MDDKSLSDSLCRVFIYFLCGMSNSFSIKMTILIRNIISYFVMKLSVVKSGPWGRYLKNLVQFTNLRILKNKSRLEIGQKIKDNAVSAQLGACGGHKLYLTSV